MNKILEISNLQVDFVAESDKVRAVDGISLSLNRGETLGIAGESGSGKSVTALSVMRLLPESGSQVIRGLIQYTPDADKPAINLTDLPDSAMPGIRGAEISMIFQEPMTSLNPVFRCGLQITEAIRLHRKVTFEAAKAETLQLFEKVKLSDPARIFNAYPHQISGGQKQRVMIAMALSCQPKILIADEPTTALDPTVQKATLDLLRQLKDESGLSMLFISHDIGVIARICDRLAIMYQGKIVETGLVTEILHAPRHPYTKGLLACRSVIDRKWHRLPTIADYIDNGQPDIRVVDPAETKTRQKALYDAAPVMEVTNLTVRYPATKNWLGQPLTWLAAVDNATFSVYPGETFGIAGESGCGKTTLGRAIARLTPATSGAVKYEGTDLLQLSDAAMRRHRRDIQMIFQDPYASLNPGKTIGAALTEPMEIHQLFDTDTARQERAVQLLETVGLQADHLKRLPHSFSGGQRQRICIARALAVEPKFLICDEIVSSLDVSVQATILNLLADLQVQFGLTYLFISHDLGVIRQMCDRLLVLKNGAIETLGVPDDLFRNPPTEYVRQLIGAVLA